MVDKSKKVKKGTINDEDICTLLQRYSVDTVLGLMQEVAHVAGEKIDWHEVAKNTATGISSARECQMLWRHLAYGEALADQLDDEAEPMDADSDLEHELEAFPAISREASAEAAACVKVLIASGYPSDSHLPNNSTIEAPLTINVPNIKEVSASSDSSLLTNVIQSTNISIPVSVQKQPLSSGVCGEKRPNNGASGVNLPPRRRRRSWSTEEDMKLTAAVQKHGERNWANIARGEFNNDRKPSELSQRWGSLRKKQDNSKVGTSSQPSETQLAAAHRAMSFALNMPMGDNKKAVSLITAAGTTHQHQIQKASASPADQQLGRAGSPNPQLLTNWPSANPTLTPDSMVKAAAVAAGARIATSADATSLIEAARSQNVMHFTTGGSSVMKSSSTSTHQLPSNVHFIRNGLAKAPISSHSPPKPNMSGPGEAQQAQGPSTKPAVPLLNVTCVKGNAAASVRSFELSKSVDDAVVSTSSNEIKELIQSNQGADLAELSGCAPVEQVTEKHQTSSSGNSLKEKPQEDQASVSMSDPISQTTDDDVALPCSEVEDNGKTNTDDQFARKEVLKNPNPFSKHLQD